MEPRIIYPSRVKALAMLAGSIGFTAIGAWMISEGNRAGWFPAGFFGLCALVFVVLLLPNNSYLRVGPEGFEMRSLFRSHTYRWSEVTGFGVTRVGVYPGQKMVVFNFSEEVVGGVMLRRASVALCGWDGGLPTVYAMSPESLAELLNAYKAASVSV